MSVRNRQSCSSCRTESGHSRRTVYCSHQRHRHRLAESPPLPAPWAVRSTEALFLRPAAGHYAGGGCKMPNCRALRIAGAAYHWRRVAMLGQMTAYFLLLGRHGDGR